MSVNFIQSYSEVKKSRKKTTRDYARHTALNSLSFFNKFRESALSKARIQFIYIHHLFQDEERHLEKLIDRLQKHHEFIPYSLAVEKLLNGDVSKPYIVISSDDGFKNNRRMSEILDAYDIKACFFINPSIIEVKNYLAIQDYCTSKLHFPVVEFLSWNDIDALLSNGHEIGSHTMAHSNVASMSYQEILDDMQQCREIILEKCGTSKHFAFPFGRFFHFSEEGRKACFETGYDSCASAERGCHIPTTGLKKEDLCIRRDHVILDWDFRHIEYFLINNAKNINPANNLFPYSR